jgi:Uma2 family endonuclease
MVPMQPLADTRRAWTIADLEQLDIEDWRRYEIVDGSLAVSPSPGREHEFVVAALRDTLRRLLPDTWAVLGSLGVELGRSYRIPDILVVHRRAREAQPSGHLRSDEVLLVVEVVSPGSVTTDRVTKPAQYAAAGIRAFWRVETDPISLSAYVLRAGTYAEVGTWGLGETARITEPFPVTIEVDRLAAG